MLMDKPILANGSMIKDLVKVSIPMKMVLNFLDNLKMGKNMVKAFILKTCKHQFKVIGSMTF